MTAVEEIFLKLGLSDLIVWLAVEVDEHAHRPSVVFLGAFAHTSQLQGAHGLRIIIMDIVTLLSFFGRWGL